MPYVQLPQFLTAGVIASYEQGAGGVGWGGAGRVWWGGCGGRNEAPGQFKRVNHLRYPNVLRACFTICNAKG